MADENDIQLVREEEGRRGRRPIDIAARKRRAILLQKFKEALESNDEGWFKEAIIHELGQLPGTPEYAQSMKIWRKFHGRS